MQDPNENTEWNDILRARGILPPKPKEVSEEDITQMVEAAAEKKILEETRGTAKPLEDMSIDELYEMQDIEDERALQKHRAQRMAEIMASQAKPTFGSLLEITGADYIPQINKAGKDVWVVLHLFQPYIPLCNLINKHLSELAMRFPHTKFIRSICSDCIKNYPDKNLPTLFIYLDGDMKSQLIGPHTFNGMNLRVQDLEWILSKKGALKTELESDPRKDHEIRDVFSLGLAATPDDGFSDDDDD